MFDDSDADLLVDLFACAALIGIVSRGEITNRHEMARVAYMIASAMLHEKNSNEVYDGY